MARGAAPEFVLTTGVQQTLELAMMDEAYFLQELASRPLEEVPGEPGCLRGEFLLPQYSPFDPETGVWRRVEVLLRERGSRYEVYDVRGLKVRRETTSTR
jgi:hypothetical protein